ncbi:MAG: hypothetical protein Q9187_009632, partial [Circinaria calcarea]
EGEEEEGNVLVACEMGRSEDDEMVILVKGVMTRAVELLGFISRLVVVDVSVELATVTNAMVDVDDPAIQGVRLTVTNDLVEPTLVTNAMVGFEGSAVEGDVRGSIPLELSLIVIDSERSICWLLLLELTSEVMGSSALVGTREAVPEVVTEVPMEFIGSTGAVVVRVSVAKSRSEDPAVEGTDSALDAVGSTKSEGF